jgi:Protein of unknown function (DUF2934)
MASKITENNKTRGRKVTSVPPPPTILEPRREVVAVNPFVSNLEEEIRRRAYELYLERGCSAGKESEDWIAAEREVRSRLMKQAG